MIIPIRHPTTQNDEDSIENVEWVMIELNGELLKPLDETNKNGDDDANKSVELGSVKFDSAVSYYCT